MAISGSEQDPSGLRIEALRNVPVRQTGRTAGENVVFFGNTLGVECQRCGAYNQTNLGHKFCAHVSCPIALREFKRRQRKRTSSLEKVYLPRTLAKRSGIPPGEGAPKQPVSASEA